MTDPGKDKYRRTCYSVRRMVKKTFHLTRPAPVRRDAPFHG